MLPGIITGLLIVLFLAGWAWAWSPRRKRAFDDAADVPQVLARREFRPVPGRQRLRVQRMLRQR